MISGKGKMFLARGWRTLITIAVKMIAKHENNLKVIDLLRILIETLHVREVDFLKKLVSRHFHS